MGAAVRPEVQFARKTREKPAICLDFAEPLSLSVRDTICGGLVVAHILNIRTNY